MSSSRLRRMLPTVVAVLVVGVGCADGGAESTTTLPPEVVTSSETSTATTSATPTATEAPATTEGTATTTTSSAESPTVRYVYDGFPEGAAGAHGSGCSPGAGDLPDGIWFGFVEDWTASSIEFDLACFYTGQAAAEEAAARGEESPPPNDFLIVNDNAALRTVAVAPAATGYRLDQQVELNPVPFADFVADPGEFQACPGSCLMWLYVNGGLVTEVVSQYVP